MSKEWKVKAGVSVMRMSGKARTMDRGTSGIEHDWGRVK